MIIRIYLDSDRFWGGTQRLTIEINRRWSTERRPSYACSPSNSSSDNYSIYHG